jgi:hypothetical protein
MKPNRLLGLAAGIAEGLTSHFAWSLPVHAQSVTVVGGPPAPPQVYSASRSKFTPRNSSLLIPKGDRKPSSRPATSREPTSSKS